LVKVGAEGETRCNDVMAFERPDGLGTIADLGLSLAEAKQLLATVQPQIVAEQAADHAAHQPTYWDCRSTGRVPTAGAPPSLARQRPTSPPATVRSRRRRSLQPLQPDPLCLGLHEPRFLWRLPPLNQDVRCLPILPRRSLCQDQNIFVVAGFSPLRPA
jgi:hypothetical protein